MARRALAVALFAIAMLTGTAVAQTPVVQRHPVYGGVEASFGTCPADSPPPAGTVCIENYIIAFHGYGLLSGGSLSPVKAPLLAYAQTVLLEFTGTEEPEATLLREGFGEFGDASLTVDTVGLERASLTIAIPMSDGSTFDFTGTWVATSERFVYGNDGPATGTPHHVVDACHTFVANGHQKFRHASMTGTLGGEPVQSYPWDEWAANIFNNRFLYIDVQHASCL